MIGGRHAARDGDHVPPRRPGLRGHVLLLGAQPTADTLLPGTDPNPLVFRFKAGTNGPGDGHMEQLAIIFDAPDHHVEEWTYLDKGKELPASHFDFHRKP